MPKMMIKNGDTTPIYYDELLFNENPSLYQILEIEPAPELVIAKPKKAKPVTTDDELNTSFDIDVL